MKKVVALVLALLSLVASCAFAEGAKVFDHTVLEGAEGYSVDNGSPWTYSVYYNQEATDELIQVGFMIYEDSFIAGCTPVFVQVGSWDPANYPGENKRLFNEIAFETDKAVYTISLMTSPYGANLMLTNNSKALFEGIANSESLAITLKTGSDRVKLSLSDDDIALFREYAANYVKYDLLTYSTQSYDMNPVYMSDLVFPIKVETKK